MWERNSFSTVRLKLIVNLTDVIYLGSWSVLMVSGLICPAILVRSGLVLAPELAGTSSSSATPNQVDTCHLLAKYPVLHKLGEHHASYSWLNPQASGV